jgi:hypothetical protein
MQSARPARPVPVAASRPHANPAPPQPHPSRSPRPSPRLAHPSQKIISAAPKIQGSAHPSRPAPRPRSAPPSTPQHKPPTPVTRPSPQAHRNPKRPQENPRETREGPREAQEGPKRNPREAQEGPERSPADPGQRRKAPHSEGATRGVRGVAPPGDVASPAEAAIKSGEHRATPGGYGGKPPGVAFIGVPTGARNAGSGAPAGDQSTDMNVTRKRPRLCQDLITVRSQDDAEQANHEADKLSLERGGAGR